MQSRASAYVYDFDVPPALANHELTRLLGGKGANLVAMATDLGLPVPPGFTITTEACAEYLAGRRPDGLDEELRAHMARLGERAGRRFGDPADPLLVSVRSGAPVSMPGMMDTILNLGLNETTAKGLARSVGDAGFAADCLLRFGDGYRAVIGAGQVPDDPWLQLRSAIEAVFRSWNSARAQAYRRREHIADDLGTAVTVQAMVFGNRGQESGSGVLFTRNPATGERTPYGDIMFNAQGEDVVAGGQQTQPLGALDERLPAVAAELRGYANVLEHHYADLCDIEFTIEQGRLWLLQVRVGKRSSRAALRMAIDMAEDESFPCTRTEAVGRVALQLADPPRVFVRVEPAPAPIATGLPASPGVATGAIVTSSDAAVTAAEAGQVVILVRLETSPEDVPGMARAAGLLTARGGLASHAAVVARGWGIPAVVGAADVYPRDEVVQIGAHVLARGERITIDGSTGEVFLGELPGSWRAAPEAATLLGWAADLGIDIESTDTATSEHESGGASAPAHADGDGAELAPTEVIRALAIKGASTSDQLAAAVVATADQVRAQVERLIDSGLAESVAGQLRLTAQGKLDATAGFAADRAVIGEQRSVERLEQFDALDGRMKRIVTAWQVRQVDEEQILNDHSNARYDERVLGELAVLHADTSAWLSQTAQPFRRFGLYCARLGKALNLARAGDQRFVASPRVDSYHGVWFELHEDLLRLAGRRRSD